MRVLEYDITEEEAGWKVEHFLKERLSFSKKQISRLKFRQGGLMLNGKQCRSCDLLKPGDCLAVGLDEAGKQRREQEEYRNSRPDLLPAVLYEDADVVALWKPGGIAVHPSHGHGQDTLWNYLISRQRERGESWTPRIIGRLDLDTSGIILAAKTTEAAAALAAQREKKILRKEYLALAEGIFEEKKGVIDACIEKDPGFLNRMRVSDRGQPARTHYRVLREEEGRTLLLLELEQGRTHQIRVHLASKGHPVAGDPIYNPGRREGEMLHLHAWKLQFQKPFTGTKIEISAPLPAWCEGGVNV